MSENTGVENINDIIDDFNVVMLVTKGEDGSSHARPMSVAHHNDADASLYFATSAFTGKAAEIEQEPDAAVTMQSGNQYVSLSGKASISNDRELIKKLYSKAWDAWFPDGPEQSDIRLVKFDPEIGEYWDLSGFKGLKFLWKAGKAVANDEKVAFTDPDSHARVSL